MKKFLSAIFVLGILAGLSSIVIAVSNPDHCYVLVKCTVTLSLDVGNDTVAPYYTVSLGTHAAGSWLLSSSITVKNDGNGSIIQVDIYRLACERNASEDGTGAWSADSDAYAWQWQSSTQAAQGALKSWLGVIFSSSPPSNDNTWIGTDDTVESTTTYKAAANSNLTGPHSPYASAISGTTENRWAYPDMRQMYVRVKLPDAVADQKPRRITIRAIASMP